MAAPDAAQAPVGSRRDGRRLQGSAQGRIPERRGAALETLKELAVVQSVEASNAIEGIEAPHRRIEQLVAGTTTPRDRPEAEIAGYRDVLAAIHASAAGIPLQPSVIEQFHRDLHRYTGVPGGRFKGVDNVVEETLPDGTTRVRFTPIGWFETPAAVEELCTGFRDARDSERFPNLLLIGSFVLDFLVIHPFRDGNGRMSRLLTLLLLYQSGYEVGRFVSIERLIDKSRKTYHDALAASTTGWHTGSHDLVPWVSYFLGVMVAAYRELEGRAELTVTRRGQKRRSSTR